MAEPKAKPLVVDNDAMKKAVDAHKAALAATKDAPKPAETK